ncbi:hypothetical protein [Inquilinus sp. OTU3971]|uniref:hypothetical protein n=1 Tax=Inquilinus sp. OTU3971 TaxID=3043855 RepID=UPI00313B6F65
MRRLRIPGGMTPGMARSVLQRRFPDLLLDLHHLYRPSGTASLPPLDFAYATPNRGPYVDVVAPGVRGPVTDASGTARLVTGTSFAVPFVVPALAADPQPADGEPAVLRRLVSRAQDLGAPGHDPIYGIGLVQAPPGCPNG